MATLDDLLTRLEALLAEIEALDEPLRATVFELLDGIDALHRAALARVGELLDAATLERLRDDARVAWLLDAYAVGVDERAAADAALEAIRPYIHSHGGSVEVVAAKDGVVRVRMAGTCAGCTASAITLREGVEKALQERLVSFVALEVEEDTAPPHPPPTQLLQIGRLARD